jgi:glycosyltransferase involved in cell wall biosynthesis
MAVYQRLVSAFLSFNPMELSQAGIHSAKVKAVELTPELDHMLTLTRNPMYDLPELDLRGAFPVVLSVARLHPDKGHEYAIRAWPRVAAQWPRGRLLIVGAGEDDARLRRLAAEFMVADTVIFAGHRSDLAALFTRADINLRTSINEGVNFITIQAMAAGLPIIGLQVGAAKEVIKHMVTGLLVAVGDSGALADAINLLCVDADLAQTLGSQARTQVRSYYSIDKIAHIYTQMYRLISMGVSARQIPDMSSTMEEFDQIFSPM